MRRHKLNHFTPKSIAAIIFIAKGNKKTEKTILPQNLQQLAAKRRSIKRKTLISKLRQTQNLKCHRRHKKQKRKKSAQVLRIKLNFSSAAILCQILCLLLYFGIENYEQCHHNRTAEISETKPVMQVYIKHRVQICT